MPDSKKKSYEKQDQHLVQFFSSRKIAEHAKTTGSDQF